MEVYDLIFQLENRVIFSLYLLLVEEAADNTSLVNLGLELLILSLQTLGVLKLGFELLVNVFEVISQGRKLPVSRLRFIVAFVVYTFGLVADFLGTFLCAACFFLLRPQQGGGEE